MQLCLPTFFYQDVHVINFDRSGRIRTAHNSNFVRDKKLYDTERIILAYLVPIQNERLALHAISSTAQRSSCYSLHFAGTTTLIRFLFSYHFERQWTEFQVSTSKTDVLRANENFVRSICLFLMQQFSIDVYFLESILEVVHPSRNGKSVKFSSALLLIYFLIAIT